MDSDKEVIEIAFDRRQLELLKSTVADTQELCARCKVTMQESQELLQQVDDLLRMGSLSSWPPSSTGGTVSLSCSFVGGD